MRARLTRHLPIVFLLALVGASAALAGATSSVQVKTSRNASLDASILVSSSGRTLYHLTTEHGKKIVCTSVCGLWPPLLARKGAKLSAGVGVTKSKLGTVKRPDGKLQVTYGGLALYRYGGDSKPGQTNGQGISKTWYAISPTGALVKAKPRASTDPPPDTPPPPGGDYPYP